MENSPKTPVFLFCVENMVSLRVSKLVQSPQTRGEHAIWCQLISWNNRWILEIYSLLSMRVVYQGLVKALSKSWAWNPLDICNFTHQKPLLFPTNNKNWTATSQSSVPPTIWASAEGRNVIKLQPSKTSWMLITLAIIWNEPNGFFLWSRPDVLQGTVAKGELGGWWFWTFEQIIFEVPQNQQHGVQNPVRFILKKWVQHGDGWSARLRQVMTH